MKVSRLKKRRGSLGTIVETTRRKDVSLAVKRGYIHASRAQAAKFLRKVSKSGTGSFLKTH